MIRHPSEAPPPDGNIALTGELDLTGTRDFTLGLAFGNSQHHAVSTLFQSLSTPFAEHEKRYAEQWGRTGAGIWRDAQSARGSFKR